MERSAVPPVQEALPHALARNLALAAVAGLAFARLKGNLGLVPAGTAFALWFTLGGHFVELAFLRFIRARLAEHPTADLAARLVTWFVGGVLLGIGMLLTRKGLFGEPFTMAEVALAGIVLIGLESVVHGIRALRGLPHAFSGRG